jgi:myosin-5
MTMLNYLHEAAILFNLRTRFFAARPYTYTGDICIAVNPYQWLDIYTETTRKVRLHALLPIRQPWAPDVRAIIRLGAGVLRDGSARAPAARLRD